MLPLLLATTTTLQNNAPICINYEQRSFLANKNAIQRSFCLQLQFVFKSNSLSGSRKADFYENPPQNSVACDALLTTIHELFRISFPSCAQTHNKNYER